MRLHRIFGLVLLAAAALLQASGLCWPLEKGLLSLVPKSFLPKRPATVLITLDPGEQGLRPLDVAMALRGLFRFHPACVVVNGVVEPETTQVPLLAGLLSKLRDAEFPLILPAIPTPTSRLASVPLSRFDPVGAWVPTMAWPMFDGFAAEENAAPWLPLTGAADGSLPLLGLTAKGEPIASLWWQALRFPTETISLLVLGRCLVTSGGHPLWITETATLRSQPPGDVKLMPLDDFLLRIEQGERGTIHPGFDALWERSTVILGSAGDLPRAASLSSLLQRVSFRIISPSFQGGLLLVWCAFFLLLSGATPMIRRTAALLLLACVLSATVVSLHTGWMPPFLPGILLCLLLLTPPRFRRPSNER